MPGHLQPGGVRPDPRDQEAGAAGAGGGAPPGGGRLHVSCSQEDSAVRDRLPSQVGSIVG